MGFKGVLAAFQMVSEGFLMDLKGFLIEHQKLESMVGVKPTHIQNLMKKPNDEDTGQH